MRSKNRKHDGTYQAADKAKDAGQQQADSGENLTKRLHEEAPEGVELLLGVRHVLNLALSIINRLGDGASKLYRS